MSRSMNAFAGDSSSDSSDEDQDDFLYPSRNPNEDEFIDHNPRKRRRTGRDAKKDAALGIFGSESEDDGPARRWKSKNMRSKGLSFVKSGQTLNSSDEDDGEGEDDGVEVANLPNTQEYLEPEADEDMGDAEEQTQKTPERLGLGASKSGHRPDALGSGGGGLGWRGPAAPKAGFTSSVASPFGRGFVPSSAADPILRADLVDEPPPTRTSLPSAFQTPTSVKQGRVNSASNGSAANPQSFAARMMAKMGYQQGKGLGKDGQGRSGVIEVQLRPQGVGLGAVKEKSKQEKEEERRQAALKGEILEDSDDEKQKRRRRQSKGTGSGVSTPKQRPKPKYQSLPEIQRQAPGLKIPEVFTPILDLTGPDRKLLTSSSGILTPTSGTESTELVEARKLARRAQKDLGAFVEEWKNLEERKAWIKMEMAEQQKMVEEQTESTGRLRSAAAAIDGVTDFMKDGQWDPVIEALAEVEKLGAAGNDELANIAVAAIHPFFRQAMEGWQPLEDPKLTGIAAGGFAPALIAVHDVLVVDSSKRNRDSSKSRLDAGSDPFHYSKSYKMTAFESMMHTIWLPKIRSAITNTWDVHDPNPLQNLLDIWDKLLPAFIRSQILEHLVVRKLDEAIAAWNPKKKHSSSLPHLWLFPWLQYLPNHHVDPKSSTGLVSDVKRKFRSLIDAWDFHRGVIPGLQQWHSVLQPGGGNDQWTPLIMNHVLPNLAKFLRQTFQVAPQDQEPYMQYLNRALEWQEILGSRMMGQILVDEIFPMWQDVLHQWLTLDDVNYAEIGEWFEFWQSIIPASLNEVPAVQAEWARGNDLINQALDLGPTAKSRLPAPSRHIKQVETPKPAPIAVPAAAAVPEVEEVTFRHQVEDWALARELQFIPEKTTLEAAGPVYRVTAAAVGKGGILIYLRGDEIYAQIKRGEWTRLGKEMDALYELAHR